MEPLATLMEQPRARTWLWVGLGVAAIAGGVAIYAGARAATAPSLGTLKLPPR